MNPTTSGPILGAETLVIEPFHGTVTVIFSDAIIASTKRAKLVREPGLEPAFYIPFEDIYFDFLEKTNSTAHSPVKGTASFWRVTAVGESAEDFMCAYATPDTPALGIAGHGTFDPRVARIEVVPAEDVEHTPHIVE